MKKCLSFYLCKLVWTVVGLVIAVVMEGGDGQEEDRVSDWDHVEGGATQVLRIQVELDVTSASGETIIFTLFS